MPGQNRNSSRNSSRSSNRSSNRSSSCNNKRQQHQYPSPKIILHSDSGLNQLSTIIVDKYKYWTNPRAIVSVGGCSRCGKSWLIAKVSNLIRSRGGLKCIVVSLDNWLIGINARKPNSTVRERYEYAKIETAFKSLIDGKPIYHPIYEPRSRLRIAERSDKPISIDRGVIFADGVVALDIPKLRIYSMLRIYVELLDDKLRLERLREFYRDFKGCDEFETSKIIAEREREEVKIIKSTKQYADIIYKF